MPPTKRRILCIDNHASSNWAVYLLERAGCEVRTASSFADAIDLAQREHFDLHLLNHELVDGFEVDSCDQLHKLTSRTPILFYSTVTYPYEPIKAIRCRRHGELLEPTGYGNVVQLALRLIKANNSSGAPDLSHSTRNGRESLSKVAPRNRPVAPGPLRVNTTA